MDDQAAQREQIKQRELAAQKERVQKREEEQRKAQELRDKAKKSITQRNQKTFWEKYQDYFAYGALGFIVLFILVSSFTGDRRKLSEIPVNEEEYIGAINDASKDFSVAKNPFFEGATLQTVKEMANNKFSTRKSISRCNTKLVEDVEVPNDYNFYAEFPNCRTDEELLKTSTSYSQVPISLFRNRNCRAGGDTTFVPSLKFLFACDTKHNAAAKGGFIANTLDFMGKHGIINEQCWNEINGTEENAKKDLVCPDAESLKKCTKEYVEKFCVFETVDEIKKEIKKNGPVASFLLPYRDLLIYKSGVYKQEENKMKVDGIVFAKIVGWETNEDKTQSWLVDPLWGREYGYDGLAKIQIGTEESLLDKIGLVIYPTAMEKSSEISEEEAAE
jgi:hypothetical protein